MEFALRAALGAKKTGLKCFGLKLSDYSVGKADNMSEVLKEKYVSSPGVSPIREILGHICNKETASGQALSDE